MIRIILFLLIMPALVFAGEAHEAHEANKFIWSIHGNYIIDFFVGVGIMWWLLAPTLKKFFKDRSEQVRDAMDQAKAAMDRAEAKLAEYKEHIENIQAEMDGLLASYRAKGEEEKQAAMHDAVAAAEAMKRQSEARVALAVAKVNSRVRGDVINKAVDEVTDMLKKQGGLMPNTGMVDRFIKEMETL